MATSRVVVVGTGPSGVRAAETLSRSGLRPIVVDESPTDGGQIYRRQPVGFHRTYATLYGTEARRASRLHQTFENLRAAIDYRPGTLAWNVSERQLYCLHGGISAPIPFDALIIASGAIDRVMPVRGWEAPGVYSLGAAQIALKSQACAIGRKVVFMGTGPLLYLVASQYLHAGGGVVAVLDVVPARFRIRALPKLAARPGTLAKGMRLVSYLIRSGVLIRHGIRPLEIISSPDGFVHAVAFKMDSGKECEVECDSVALGYHLSAESQLADLAGCQFHFDSVSQQWLPIVDRDGRSTVSGVYLAGDGARLLGADGAEAMGELAGLTVLADLGLHSSASRMAHLRREIARMELFRQGLAEAFPWPASMASDLSADTIVCRCEAVTAGEIRNVADRDGNYEINRVKAFSRTGMGRCQGRYCRHGAAEIIAAAGKIPTREVGRLRGQAPVKPLPIGVKAERL
jgi:NADPH-dependent 2,4-dienoyl-CoA reductase/sulfur reductase-like enzyme